MPPLRALLQPPQTAPAGPPRPQGPLSVADRLMTLAQGLMGVNQPEPTDFQTPQDFGQADYWHGLGEMLGLAPAIVAPMMAIKAYHGSPHDFSSFDLSKIGTGEGAQAYGHGLYFAENPTIAKTYRDELSGKQLTIAGQPPKDFPKGKDFYKLSPEDVVDYAADDLLKQSLNTNFGRNYSPEQYADDAMVSARLLANKTTGKEKAHWQAVEQNIKAKIPQLKTGGNLYEVNIHASPDELLDWDKPLSQQSQKVQEAFRSVYSPRALEKMRYRAGVASHRDLTGAQLYQMGGTAESSEAAQKLKDAGIKGIQYLDQGSRATTGGELLDVFKEGDQWRAKIVVRNRGGIGFTSPTDAFTTSMPFKTEAEARAWADSKINTGTRNFVIFDDKIIEIAKKYGIALPAAASLYKWQQQQKKGVE